MWHQLLTHLTSYAKSKIPDVDIAMGSYQWENIANYPAIRISRGGEGDLHLFTRGKEEVTFFVEFWAKCSDHTPEAGYEKLAAIEDSWWEMFKQWIVIVQKELKLNISDLDIPSIGITIPKIRPQIGSRAVIILKHNR